MSRSTARLDGRGITYDHHETTRSVENLTGLTPCVTVYATTSGEAATKRDEIANKLTPPWTIIYIYGTSPMVMQLMSKLADGQIINGTVNTTGLGMVA